MTRTVDARKRQLLCESELNRKVLQIEIGQWHLRTARWQARASTAQKCFNLASPLISIFLPRKFSSVLGIARAFFSFRK
jgi:hypothetical protein